MNKFYSYVSFCYGSFRPFLGSLFVCIYEKQESCSAYAARQFRATAWYKAFLKTIFRIFSCNPITGIILEIKWWANHQ